MQWISNRTWEYERQQKKCWHLWFAWYPITINTYPDGAKMKIWFKTVLRKGTLHSCWDGCYWTYEYKSLPIKRRFT